MKSKVLVVLFVAFMAGCGHTYRHSELQSPDKKLDGTLGVLISTPEDGWYELRDYPNSGRMTADAVRIAFSRYASKVDVVKTCHGDDCLENIDTEQYGYYVKPEILHWEARTKWSGKSDRIEIQLVIYDAVTKKELANSSYTGKSRWLSIGDYPQDFLREPTNEYVRSLYE